MQSIQFDLYKLGWKAFEDLISCILKETLGQTFQVFSDGVDGGRDGAFYGSWSETSSGEIMNGSFTVQCKHTSKQDMKLPKGVICDELPKIERLARKGLADTYLLFTNYSVSAETAAMMEKKYGRQVRRLPGFMAQSGLTRTYRQTQVSDVWCLEFTAWEIFLKLLPIRPTVRRKVYLIPLSQILHASFQQMRIVAAHRRSRSMAL